MRFNEDEVSRIIDKYTLEIKEKFINEVKEEFLKLAAIQFKEYEEFKDNDLLDLIFKNSIFMNLLTENFNFVYEESVQYWSNHIIQEIKKVVDFDKLSK